MIEVRIVEAVQEGRVAWARLQKSERTSWLDWLSVARAISIGRTESLKAAGTNSPAGTKYNRAMGAWLKANGLDGISTQERYRALLILENLAPIEKWRATLPEGKQRKLNHPGACWHAWRRATKPNIPTPAPTPDIEVVRQRIAATAAKARSGRAVYWSQDALRRAHHAMLESRSHDLLTLARLALQAAIKTEDDLLALLPASATEKPATSGRPAIQKSAQQPAHAG